MVHNLWTSFSTVPLAVSQYDDPVVTQPAPVWVEQFHPVVMARHRAGTVRFPIWERSADMIHDIRDLARLVGPSYFASFAKYTAGTSYDQTQF
jgi:hypothetical protein